MIRVSIIESPFAAPTPEGIARNRRYLDACILDCVRRGETPYASHKMLTDALDDANPEEREQGIAAGFAMRQALSDCQMDDDVTLVTAVYTDLGISSGMVRGMRHSEQVGIAQETRVLGGEWAR